VAEPAEVDEKLAPLSVPLTDPRSVDQLIPLHADPSGRLHVMLMDDLVLTFIDEGFAERVHVAVPADGAAGLVGIARAELVAMPKRASTNNTENIDELVFMYTTLSYFVFYLFIILVPL